MIVTSKMMTRLNRQSSVYTPQTSEGLHSLTEEQALEKSRIIQKLLEFVIVKIYEERSQIKDLREAINKLKS